MRTVFYIRDARLVFKNFSGKPDRFNKDGTQPNFSIVIPEEEVGYYADDLGFNVKKRVNDDGTTFHFLRVKIGKYGKIYIRDEDYRTEELPPERYGELDSMFLQTCDIGITANNYDAGGRKGTSAYLSELFAQKGERSELYKEWMIPKDETTHD